MTTTAATNNNNNNNSSLDEFFHSHQKKQQIDVTISILTMNVYNVDYYLEDRLDYICDLLLKLGKPDLVVFQEVPSKYARQFIQNLRIDDYYTYHSIGNMQGNVIACRYPMFNKQFVAFQNCPM